MDVTNDVIVVSVICGTVIVCLGIILYAWKKIIDSNNKSKERLLELNTLHEMVMKKVEWEQKMEWEKVISDNLDSKLQKELEKLKENIQKEKDDKEKLSSLMDLNRATLLHILLSESREPLSKEKLEKEIEKVEKTYQLLKDKLS